jgi:type IV secretory pathway VirB2 component (pilin)
MTATPKYRMQHHDALLAGTNNRLNALLGLGVALCALLPANAYAVSSPMGAVLCAVIAVIYGNLGRACATLAVIALGAGGMFGKITWGAGITVVVGIGILFGALGTVDWVVTNMTGVAGVC